MTLGGKIMSWNLEVIFFSSLLQSCFSGASRIPINWVNFNFERSNPAKSGLTSGNSFQQPDLEENHLKESKQPDLFCGFSAEDFTSSGQLPKGHGAIWESRTCHLSPLNRAVSCIPDMQVDFVYFVYTETYLHVERRKKRSKVLVSATTQDAFTCFIAQVLPSNISWLWRPRKWKWANGRRSLGAETRYWDDEQNFVSKWVGKFQARSGVGRSKWC